MDVENEPGRSEDIDWFEVSVAKGNDISNCQCLLKTWVDCIKSGNIGLLWEKVKQINSNFLKYDLVKSYTLSHGQNSRAALIVPLHMPLTKLPKNVTVWFLFENIEEEDSPNYTVQNPSNQKRNAFEMLMSNKKSGLGLKDIKNKKHEMYNDVVQLLNINFLQSDIHNGKRLIDALVECFWCVEANHERFVSVASNGHCIKLPDFFKNVYEKSYRDFSAQKKAKPTLNYDSLMKSSNNLFDILSYWNGLKTVNESLLNHCRCLADSLRSYADYLKKTNERMATVRTTLDDSLKESIGNPIEPVSEKALKACYKDVNELISKTNFYEPITLDNDINDVGLPADRRLRHLWLKDLKLCYRYSVSFNKSDYLL